MAKIEFLGATLLLATGLAAQSYLVVPNHRATTPGNAADGKPFSYDRVRHEQYIGRSQLLPLGAQAMIRSIAYRPDGTQVGIRVDLTTANPTWSIRMANAIVNPAQPTTGSYFPPAQLTTVFQPRRVSWPYWSAGGPTPAPFLLTFPFDVPFPYGGGHVVISHYSFNTALSVAFNYFFDAETSGPDIARISAFGASCPADQNQITGSAANPGGGDLALYLHNAPPQAPSVAFLGHSRTSWSGVRLPLDLAPVGLAGCSIYIAPLLFLPATVQASGLAEARWSLPADPSLLGTTLFGQFLVAQDPRVNPQIGLTTSAALDIALGFTLGIAVPEIATIAGTLAQANAPGGLLFPGEGLVVRLEY